MPRYKVAQKGFAGNHLLNINAVIENKDESPAVLSDVIYMEFAEGIKKNNVYCGYDTKNKISVKFNSYELRIFRFALRSLISNKKSDYKKYNNPSLSNSTDGVKEISLGFSTDKFWINIEEAGNKKFGIAFDILELRALIETLELISKETDEVLYKYQRAMDAKMNK